MNQLIATIKKIDTMDHLNIVEFDFFNTSLKMMSLDLSEDIKIDKKVKLCVKPTCISIAKNLSGEISLSNKITATIQSINNGHLLCSILLNVNDTIIESIITVDSSKRMNLKQNNIVTILIKASDLFIQEILND